MAHFSICLKSFDRNCIKRAQRQLQQILSLVSPVAQSADQSALTATEEAQLPGFLKAEPQGIVHLPTTRSKLTVLTSPHIDKRSREQFEIVRRKVRIEFQLDQVKAEIFYGLLKHIYLGGVQLSVRVKTHSYLQ